MSSLSSSSPASVVDTLVDLIRFPTVSATGHKGAYEACADYILERFNQGEW